MSKDLEVMIAVREVDSDSDSNGTDLDASLSGDGSIRTHVTNDKYRNGWDAVFGKVKMEEPKSEQQPKPIDKNAN
jgi:hypothetical protein